MDDSDKAKNYVELWKQTITVQQHFNDIGWRIRQLALTALTFALGAAAVAARERTAIGLFGVSIQLSATILMFGLILWISFYFVDQVWYHRLLVGAVRHGEELEVALRQFLPEAGLTRAISAASPYGFRVGLGRWSRTWSIHSATKLRIFYLTGASALIVVAVALQVSA